MARFLLMKVMLADPYKHFVLSLKAAPAQMPQSADLTALGTKALGPLGLRSHETMSAILEHVKSPSLLALKTKPHLGEETLAMLVCVKSWPLQHYTSHCTAISQCSLPIINEVGARDTVKAFMQKLDRPLLLRSVEVNHPVLRLLQNESADYKILHQWQRASLNTKGSFDAWMTENFDHKRRKELKRLRKRLEEQGQLELVTLSNAVELPGYIDEFLRLEDESWKGSNGTSIKQDDILELTLRTSLKELFNSGKLRFWSLRLNGVTIASLYAVVDQNIATLGKIAYDQTFAKYSPGVLIVIDATKAFFDCPQIDYADSNAIPGHPMIDRLWRDRLDVADVLLAPPNISIQAFKLLQNYYCTYISVRSQLKKIYYSLKGVQPS